MAAEAAAASARIAFPPPRFTAEKPGRRLRVAGSPLRIGPGCGRLASRVKTSNIWRRKHSQGGRRVKLTARRRASSCLPACQHRCVEEGGEGGEEEVEEEGWGGGAGSSKKCAGRGGLRCAGWRGDGRGIGAAGQELRGTGRAGLREECGGRGEDGRWRRCALRCTCVRVCVCVRVCARALPGWSPNAIAENLMWTNYHAGPAGLTPPSSNDGPTAARREETPEKGKSAIVGTLGQVASGHMKAQRDVTLGG